MLLYYIRHGEPIYDPDSLTEQGHLQAQALAKRLALYGLDEIYASTSTRAIQTAMPTSRLLHKPITRLDCFNEKYAWQYFTVPADEGKRTWAFHSQKYRQLFLQKEVCLNDRWYRDDRFAGDAFEQGVAYIDRHTDDFLLSLGYRHDRARGLYVPVAPTEKRIGLFAHQGMGMAFLSSLLDIPYPQFCTHFDLSHSSMTVIAFPEKDGVTIPQVLTYSNDSHLYKEGLSTQYNHTLEF